MTNAELESLHARTIGRRYDLRVCNPAHGPFYAFMARYQEQVDDPDALRGLAAEIEAYAARPGVAAEMRAAYGQLAELARWRAEALRAA